MPSFISGAVSRQSFTTEAGFVPQVFTSGALPSALAKGVGGVTVLRREANGTVTIVSLAQPWRASLTREANGTVTVRAA